MIKQLTAAQRFRVRAALQTNGLTMHLTQKEALQLASALEFYENGVQTLEQLQSLKSQYALAIERADKFQFWFFRLATALAIFWSFVAWAGWI